MSRPVPLILAALAALASAAAAAPPPEVVLARSARLATATVTLGDIASVRGGDPAQRKLVRALPLGPLPIAGRTRTWSQAMIRVRLRAAGLEASVAGEKVAHVRGRYLTIPARRQLALARTELARRSLTPGATLGKIRPLHVRLAGTIALSAKLIRRSRSELRVQVTATSGEARVSQVLRLRRRSTVGRKGPRVHKLARRGKRKSTRLPAKPRAPRTQDTRATPTRSADATRSANPTREPLARVEPSSAEASGPLVRTGEEVTVVARRGAIELTLRGRARTTGAKGDRIQVRLLGASRRTVPARVTALGRVTLLEGSF